MQVSMINVIIVLEALLVAVLGCIGLFVFYRKRKKQWDETLLKVQKKLRRLKDMRRRCDTLKHNLHKLLAEKKKLMAQMKDSEDAPELRKIINGLNIEIIEKSKKYKSVKKALDKKQNAVDELVNELEQVSNSKKPVKALTDSNTEHSNPEEFNRLKTMNSEQRLLINKLKEELSDISENGGESDPTIIPKLEQLLKESETCIEMLESELAIVMEKLNQNGSGDDGEVPPTAPAEDNSDIVMTLMNANGDQSNIINFSRNSIACESLGSLAEEILKTVSGYGLEGILQLRSKSGTQNFSESEVITEIHKELLKDDLGGERFLEEGARLVIRFEQISLLVLGMPKDNQETFTRYRDSLAIILELANDGMKSIEHEESMKNQHGVLKKLISTTQDTLKNVEAQFKEQAVQSEMIINSMTDVLGNPTFVKEMSEAFRPIYQGIVEETKERFETLHKESAAVDESFAQVIDDLSKRI